MRPSSPASYFGLSQSTPLSRWCEGRAGRQAGRAAGITSWLDQGFEVSVTALDIGLAGKAEMLGRVASGLTSPYFPRETTDSVDPQICSRHEEDSS